MPCGIASSLQQWNPWPVGPRPWEAILCDIDGEEVPCPELKHDMPRPAQRPPGITEAHLYCNYQSVANLGCGHAVQLSCLDAINALDHWECMEVVPVKCDACEHERDVQCHNKQVQDRTGVKDRCENKVDKKCTVCSVNYNLVACYKHDVRCDKGHGGVGVWTRSHVAMWSRP